MKRILRHWPMLFMIVACVSTLILFYLMVYTDKLNAYDALDISLDCFLGILPIGAFLTSICYGILHGGIKKIWSVPVCGVLYMITYVITDMPDESSVLSIEGILICLQVSMIAIIPAAAGMLLGCLIRLVVSLIRKKFIKQNNEEEEAQEF